MEATRNTHGLVASRVVVLDDRRPSVPVPAVQERLREGADDNRHVHRLLPLTEVPPLDVARMQAVLRGAAIGLVAVDEVEPITLRRQRAMHAFDRFDVAPRVTRRHLRHALEPLHRGQPSRHVRHLENHRPAVPRDDTASLTLCRGGVAGASARA